MKDKISVMITEEELLKRISDLAGEISRDFAGESVHLVCILKGSVFFTCELAKRLTIPATFDFMQVSSYGDGTKSSGVVRISKDTDEALEGKNVLVIEDIVDSGRTLSYLLGILSARKPKVLKLCTLLDKPSRRIVPVEVDYTGFEVEDRFVVGFGMDYAQKYRNLPYIGVIEELGDES